MLHGLLLWILEPIAYMFFGTDCIYVFPVPVFIGCLQSRPIALGLLIPFVPEESLCNTFFYGTDSFPVTRPIVSDAVMGFCC